MMTFTIAIRLLILFYIIDALSKENCEITFIFQFKIPEKIKSTRRKLISPSFI
jgi:hypothetical protein